MRPIFSRFYRAARRISDDVDPYYWKHQCSQGLIFAVKNVNLEMAEWLHAYFLEVLPYNAFLERRGQGKFSCSSGFRIAMGERGGS